MRLLLTLFALCGLTLLPATAATGHLTVTTGTVTQVAVANNTINVNTRLGPKSLTINSSTLVFLNDRASNLQAITAGDTVELHYRFDTGVVSLIKITRETFRRGRITAATASNVTLRIPETGTITLATDSLSHFRIDDLVVDNQLALVGVGGKAIFQPAGNNLLLRFIGDGEIFKGTLSSVDAGASTIVAGGRTFKLVTSGTVRLNGDASTLSALTVGDKVRVGFIKSGTPRSAIVIEAKH
jgi:hypothetical protein